MAYVSKDNYPTVGSRLVSAREFKGLSQSDLSRRLHTAQQNISRYESGIHDPKASMLRDFCVELDISPSYLLGLSNDPRPVDGTLSKLSFEQVELLDLWERADQSSRCLVMAGLRAVAKSSASSTDADGHSSE